MAAVDQERPPCVGALQAAIAAGAMEQARSVAQRCLAAGADPEVLEWALVAALEALPAGALPPADALRAALMVFEPLWQPASPEHAPAEGIGIALLVTLPGDRHDVGRHLWGALLKRRGFEVRDLGVRAPALIAGHAAAAAASGLPTVIGVHAFDRVVRPAVQSLVAHLLRRNQSDPAFKVPLLLGGAGIDEAFARWVAIPEGGTLYWGGVYYCEDGAEMLQVLEHIVLYQPPVPAHAHADSAGAPEEGCASCGGCPLSEGCDLVETR